jgi:hypothetical protein
VGCLVYTLLCLLEGQLPWQSAGDSNCKLPKVQRYMYRNIGKLKRSTDPTVMCANAPACMLKMLTCVQSPAFEECPKPTRRYDASSGRNSALVYRPTAYERNKH